MAWSVRRTRSRDCAPNSGQISCWWCRASGRFRGLLDFRERAAHTAQPMAIAVKICGITTPDAVNAAVAAGAVYGGLVFHPKSPRNLDISHARELARLMRGKLKVVTLLADP